MEEFLFWIILIPILFFIIVDTFSKDKHPQDIEIHRLDEDNEDE